MIKTYIVQFLVMASVIASAYAAAVYRFRNDASAPDVPYAELAAQAVSAGNALQSAPAAGAHPASQAGALAAGAGMPLFKKTGSAPAPAPNAQAALVADLETGEVYFAQNPAKRRPIASVTKLITGAAALRAIPAEGFITLTADMRSHIGDDGESNLVAGQTYARDDLIKAMMVFSSNEAAEALASHAGRAAFLADMNLLAHDWGLRITRFEDPTGLSVANQSTAEEMRALLFALYREFPSLFSLSRRTAAALTEQNSGVRTSYANINEFAGRADFLGGKTGYTDEAGGNLVSLFAYENRPIAIIVLGSDDRFGATRALLDWFKTNFTSR